MKIFYSLSILFLYPNCSAIKTNNPKIEFKADACFGTCPIFTMTVLNDGTANYVAEEYNNQQGKFITTIKKKQLDSLVLLLHQADLFNLKNSYEASITDQPTYTLTVTLQDGKIKTIEDYGPSGPDNLKKLYDFIFSLRDTQDWK